MEIFRDTAPTFALEVAGATEITATVIRDGVEVYDSTGSTFTLPFKVYGYDGPFQVRWEFFVPGDPVLHTRYEAHEIVTPLVTLGEDAVQDDIDAERLVRRIIQSICGQNFGFTYGAKAIIGSGERVLHLPQRLIHLTGVTLNVYPYDAIPFGSIHITGGGWALTTGSGPEYLTTKMAPPEDAIYSSNGVIVVPGFVNNWTANNIYIITGSWGYEGVPQDISDAASLLIDDYNCDEDTYRNKFIANMRSADWRIEYDPRTWSGTGNAKADQLIAPYIRSGYGLV